VRPGAWREDEPLGADVTSVAALGVRGLRSRSGTPGSAPRSHQTPLLMHPCRRPSFSVRFGDGRIRRFTAVRSEDSAFQGSN
jgi:hypothetical protein